MPTFEVYSLAIIVAFIVSYAIGRSYLRLSGKVLAVAIALLILIASALTMVLGQRDFAERSVIIVYYFLVVGVTLYFIRFTKEDSE